MDIFVGTFTEKQLIAKEDKKAIEQKQTETGLKFIKSKITKEKGIKVMKVWLSNQF